MEFPAASAHRGRVPWLGLLLAVFLLTFWIPPTTARFGIVSTSALEGQDVILRTQNRPPNVQGFIWYKGRVKQSNLIGFVAWHVSQFVTGPQSTGRESANLEGSLFIRNVTVRHLGIYTVEAFVLNSEKIIGFGQLNVYEPVRVPTLQASTTTVMEHEDYLVLLCDTNKVSIQWLFNGMNLQLTERMQLYWNNRTLIIDPVWREDAGNYQCEASNPISSFQSVPVELDVKY